MDDTHTRNNTGSGDKEEDLSVHPADRLAELDPADAPQSAEDHAAQLAEELEGSGAGSTEPVQLAAELDTADRTDRGDLG